MEVTDAETGEVLKLNTMTILEIDEEMERKEGRGAAESLGDVD